MPRTIQSPGIEYNEIDRSGYIPLDTENIVDTTAFVAGFADIGEDYAIKSINKITTFKQIYGNPTNEEEKYFYNAASEVLTNGGVLITAKLPYDNISKDKFEYVDYSITPELSIPLNNIAYLRYDNSTSLIDQMSGLNSVIQFITNPDNRFNTSIAKSFTFQYYDKSGNFQNIENENLLNSFNSVTDYKRLVEQLNLQLNNLSSDQKVFKNYKDLLANKSIIKSYYDYLVDSTFSSITDIDYTLTSAIKIENDFSNVFNKTENEQLSNLLTLDQLDQLKTRSQVYQLKPNTLRIVDISRRKYKSINLEFTEEGQQSTKISAIECLGIMPVLVSPINAMFFQGLLTNPSLSSSLSTWWDVDLNKEITQYADIFNSIDKIRTYTEVKNSTLKLKNITADSYAKSLSSSSIYQDSVSKTAADYFPQIVYLKENFLSREYLKQIGVVLFEVYKDSGNNSSLNFVPIESYVGSLDRNAKDPTTNQSIFIDNVINSRSVRINLFSNFRTDSQYWKDASTIFIGHQYGTIFGFNSAQSIKTISYKSSIIDPLTQILTRAIDPNRVPIDLVVDAGVSNIAAYVKMMMTLDDDELEPGEYKWVENGTQYGKFYYIPQLRDFKFNKLGFSSASSSQQILDSSRTFVQSGAHLAWKSVLKKYDDFVRTARKDCMFIADGPRQLCVFGDQPLVRKTNLSTSVSQDIIPNVQYLTGINSSYSAGYCNWFDSIDSYTEDRYWAPPSVKMVGVYIYTDSRYRTWDAPAGLKRGVLDGVIDCAFSPTVEEAGRIYNQSWNYAVNYPIDGIVVEGQRTFQINKTALDRINIRRLLLYLEKRVKIIARQFVYEQNTPYLRQRFVDTLKPIFDDAVTGGGLSDYYIRCDESNNTSIQIDNNELHCTIAVKPVKCLEFIVLNFIVTNQTANVEEETQRA